MYISIKSVIPLENYCLLLTFENDEKRIFDMNDYLDKGIFSEIKEKNLFNTVHVKFDTIEWDNGADLDPEILYLESKAEHPVTVSKS
jgi:hypothetical protein